jgi:carbon-monoxide dehydrogenase large subunit
MNDLSPDRAERSAKLKGLGHSRKRVEDQRFTQGRGNYIDDMKMPDMLFGDFVARPMLMPALNRSISTRRWPYPA